MSGVGSRFVVMNDPLAGISTALACVDATWGMRSGGDRAPANELAATTLVEVNDALGVARRHLEAVHASVASEIARRSRAELGPEGLAKQHGFRSPTALIAATTGTTMGDAGRLVAVGEATTPRMTFSGALAPARHPFVGAGMAAGTIGVYSYVQLGLDPKIFWAGPNAVIGGLLFGFGSHLFVDGVDLVYTSEPWTFPLVVLGGVLLLFVTLHLARAIGKLHGLLAKHLLVRNPVV